MYASPVRLLSAAVNSETALTEMGLCMTEHEAIRVRALVKDGIAQVSVVDGVLRIYYEWDKAPTKAEDSQHAFDF